TVVKVYPWDSRSGKTRESSIETIAEFSFQVQERFEDWTCEHLFERTVFNTADGPVDVDPSQYLFVLFTGPADAGCQPEAHGVEDEGCSTDCSCKCHR